MKRLKRILAGIGVLLLLLVGVIAINTLRYTPPEVVEVPAEDFDIDVAKAAATLSEAVRFQTISTDLNRPDFDAFIRFLEAEFPIVHANMERKIVAGKTPLFRWEGTDSSKQPILLAAHYDVVPALADSLDSWDYPPFSGEIADGFVWGRGTLDNKGALVAVLTAAEQLITSGFTPERSVYLSFSHNEEVSQKGAKAVADHLLGEGIRLAWMLDEGSFVLEGVVRGLKVPVASINVAEKGYLTLELVAKAPGGHSSLPPKVTAVGKLATALGRLQNSPVPGGLTGVSEQFFDSLGRHFPLGQRVIFANRWLFGPLLESILSDTASTNAMLRTTTAPTMLSASSKENVLATQAVATVNFRLHPRDTIEDVVEHVISAIADPDIEVRIKPGVSASASDVSDATAQGYLDIEASIRSNFGALASVPGLTVARTDASQYGLAADNSYRINPFKIDGDDIVRFHGINERLSIENLERGIGFYLSLMTKQ